MQYSHQLTLFSLKSTAQVSSSSWMKPKPRSESHFCRMPAVRFGALRRFLGTCGACVGLRGQASTGRSHSKPRTLPLPLSLECILGCHPVLAYLLSVRNRENPTRYPSFNMTWWWVRNATSHFSAPLIPGNCHPYMPTKVHMSGNFLDDSFSLTVPGMLEL